MNFLAHCFLSCTNEDVLIGNFITDFIRKSEESNYSGDIMEGILLHRKIDEFTDQHKASLQLRRILRSRHGKYASVVVDLVWDYYLSINWDHFSGVSLIEFCERNYDLLIKRKDEFPARLHSKIEDMIVGDFLASYSNKERMLSALGWLDNRVKFKSNFTGALEDIQENEELIQKLFMEFFPEIIVYVDQQCTCL